MTITAAVMLLMAHGMPLAPAAAVAAHGYVESGLDPAAVSPSNGIGLLQWHAERRTRLIAEARQQRRDWRDPDFQADFIGRELAERREGSAFLAATQPGQAALIFMQFERPRNASAGKRVALAQRIYGEFTRGSK